MKLHPGWLTFIFAGLSLPFWYMRTMFRCWDYGTVWMDTLQAVLVMYQPCVLVVWLIMRGYALRTVFFTAVAVVGVTVGASEAFAFGQEWALRHRYGERPQSRVETARWWPFETSAIYYTPGRGWWAMD